MYQISVKSAETRREDPLLTDNYAKVVETAKIMTICNAFEIRIVDIEDNRTVFLAVRGMIQVDQL